MKSNLKLAFLIVALTFTSASSSHAAAVYCTNCSDRFTQAIERVTNLNQLTAMLNQYREAINQTMQQVTMVQQGIQQYANMVQNTVNLPKNLLNELKGSFTKLASLTSQLGTDRGDINALGNVFRNIYAETGVIGELATASSDRIFEENQKWGQQVDKAAEATFQLTGAQLDALVKDQGALESHIDTLLSTPEGQMQAIQSGNSLAAMQIQETRQLRELMATVAQSQVASQMKDEKKEQLMEEQWKHAMSTSEEMKRYLATPVEPDPIRRVR